MKRKEEKNPPSFVGFVFPLFFLFFWFGFFLRFADTELLPPPSSPSSFCFLSSLFENKRFEMVCQRLYGCEGARKKKKKKKKDK